MVIVPVPLWMVSIFTDESQNPTPKPAEAAVVLTEKDFPFSWIFPPPEWRTTDLSKRIPVYLSTSFPPMA